VNTKPSNSDLSFGLREIMALFLLLTLPVLGWWAVTDKLASAGELRQEQAARIGSDYAIQYKYDKLDIERRIQSVENRLIHMGQRTASMGSWATDSEEKGALKTELQHLRAQKRDLETWYRMALTK